MVPDHPHLSQDRTTIFRQCAPVLIECIPASMRAYFPAARDLRPALIPIPSLKTSPTVLSSHPRREHFFEKLLAFPDCLGFGLSRSLPFGHYFGLFLEFTVRGGLNAWGLGFKLGVGGMGVGVETWGGLNGG